MAGTANLNIQYVDVSGNQQVQPPTVNLATPIGAKQSIVLANGNNTITIPDGTTFVTIQPPAGNVQTLTLKGVNGDTGVRISPTAFTSFSRDPTVLTATFVLFTGGAFTAATLISFT